MGITPTQYLKSVRLRKAKELLETSFLSVKQIISLVGIGDRNHFTNDFKKAYGVSPTEYRRLRFEAKPDGGDEVLSAVIPTPTVD